MSARTVRERRVYEKKLDRLCTVVWRGLFSIFNSLERRLELNFHFDELIWRDEQHQHDQAMTWLTSIESDDEFDRMVMLVRFARAFGGGKKTSLNNREAIRLRILIDKVLVRGCFVVVEAFDCIVSCRKYLRRGYNKLLRRREDAPRDDYGIPIKRKP